MFSWYMLLTQGNLMGKEEILELSVSFGKLHIPE